MLSMVQVKECLCTNCGCRIALERDGVYGREGGSKIEWREGRRE